MRLRKQCDSEPGRGKLVRICRLFINERANGFTKDPLATITVLVYQKSLSLLPPYLVTSS